MKRFPFVDVAAFINDLDRLLDRHFPIGQVFAFNLSRLNQDFLSFLHITGTYVLMRGDKIIYAGVSGDVGSRLRSHFRSSTSDAGREATRFLLIPMNSWEEAAHLEAILINRWRPKFNRTMPYGPYEGNRDKMLSIARAIEAKLKVKGE